MNASLPISVTVCYQYSWFFAHGHGPKALIDGHRRIRLALQVDFLGYALEWLRLAAHPSSANSWKQVPRRKRLVQYILESHSSLPRSFSNSSNQAYPIIWYKEPVDIQIGVQYCTNDRWYNKKKKDKISWRECECDCDSSYARSKVKSETGERANECEDEDRRHRGWKG